MMNAPIRVSRRQFTLSLAFGAASTLLGACGPSAPSAPAPAAREAGAPKPSVPTSAPPAAPAAGPTSAQIPTPRGQTFIGDRPTLRIFDSFNPFVPNGEETAGGIHQGAREYLFYANFQQGTIINHLGKGWSYNPSFTELTLDLAPNAMWSDGQPFTSDDVVWVLSLLKENSQLNGSSVIKPWLDSAAAVDPHTVKIKLASPNPRFHYIFIAGIYDSPVRIVPKHVWQNQDPNTFKFNPPVYTGPYVLDRVIPEQFMFIWKKNPNYWNKSVMDPQPQYMIWRQALPMDANAEEFQRGNIDAPGIDNFDYQHQQAIRSSYKNMIMIPFLDPCPRQLLFNCDASKPLTSKPEVRWALSSLLNREQIGKVIWQPPSPPADYWWAAWKANDRWVAPDIQKQYPFTYDPKKAGDLLNSVGATMGSGGLREFSGQPVTFDLLTPAPIGAREYQIGQSLIDEAKKVGVTINIRSLQGPPYTDAYLQGNWDLDSAWLCGVALDPGQYYQIFEMQNYVPLGQRALGSGPNNVVRLKDPALDEVARKLDVTDPTDASGKPLFERAMEAYFKALPVAPIIQTTYPISYNTTYWTGWPTADNLYNVPATWWAHFLFVMGSLKAASG
jgi:peptide/nickel transport system substrate-binding protein